MSAEDWIRVSVFATTYGAGIIAGISLCRTVSAKKVNIAGVVVTVIATAFFALGMWKL